MNKDAKIYIAGHTGLVGSAIWRTFKSKGYNNLIGENINNLDLRDQNAVSAFMQKNKPEYVIIAAAKVGGIMANNTYRAEFLFDNLMIQSNLINESHKVGVKKLIFLGSTCIYPKEAKQPIVEEELLTAPLEYTNEPYAVAKIAGMKLCENYNLQYGTNFISLMPTNIYGPNDNFNLETSHVLPALFRKIHLGHCLENNDYESIKKDLNNRPIEAVSGKNSVKEIDDILGKYGVARKPAKKSISDNNSDVVVEIWGSGKPLREFMWSEDLADAIVFTMEKIGFSDLIQNKREIRNTHINVGTGSDLSIKDLSLMISNVVGFKGSFHFDTSKPDGTFRKTISVKKINQLGWKHKVNLQEGIMKLYQWYTKYEN